MANLRVGTGITFDGATGNFNALGIGTVRGALNATGVINATGAINATSGLNVGTAATIHANGNVTCGIVTSSAFIPTGGQLSHRNIIINGDMRVAQRSTSSTTSGYTVLDRFPVFLNGADENPTIAQADVASGTTPYTLGFRKCLKITNGNQTGGAGSNDYVWIQNKIEAQDIANSGWNYTSTSSYITLSFWVKSSVAQDFKGYIETIDGTAMQYPFATGSLTQNTWTKITKSIPGHASLSFDNNVNEGFKVSVIPMMGTDKTSSSVTEDAWGTYTSSARIKDVTTTWYTTNDATFEITGVQLEVGSVATPFEHKSFHEEYLRCARYFIQMNRIPVMTNRIAGYVSTTTRLNPVPMRAIPTVAASGTLSLNVFFYGGSPAPTSTTTPGFQNNGDSGQPYGGDNFILNFSGFSSTNFQTNEFGEVYGATVTLDAEL